ncbi:iron-siderophore ABC transporter substrate-binding protein [Microcoleus sp. FACHB-1515]|uniref:iron-siderophore ABC transporter substrate-binding protein n=1 Tax=Cyanophyceae TaxID=3028117 RepID=UPI0018EFE3A6|nr:iron-siderophore ABC transporter substrate-binding protein [Microcoleus sp. FACHB-1515]
MGSTCIPRNPQRIVMLREDYWINSLKLGVQSIATVSVPGFPFAKYLEGKVDPIESVGGYGSPNLEKILSLHPDLVLAESSYSENLYKQLSQIAPTVVLNMSFPSPPWEDQLKELAYVLDKEAAGKQLINEYWRRVEELKQALGDRRHHLKVSIANTSSEYGIWSYGEKHHAGEILQDIGLQRPESQRGDFFYIENISKEKTSDLDGDVLFFVSWERENDQKTLEKLKQSPLWARLNVVQRDQVHLVGAHWHNSDIFAINAILDDLFKYLVDTP